MKMSGEQVIPASREAVWAALNDPDILKQSIAGCTELNKTSDTEFDAKVTTKVGPVKANFSGAVTLSDLNPPESYKISGEGKGGAAGFAKGGATVRLEEQDGQTLLKYDVDAQVGGKLAQIGSRLIQSTARKMAGDFFKSFAKLVTSDEDTAAAAATKPAAKKAPSKKATAKKSTTKRAAKKSSTSKTPKTEAAEVVDSSAADEAANAETVAPADQAAPDAKPETTAQDGTPGSVWMWVAGGVVIFVLIYVLTR